MACSRVKFIIFTFSYNCTSMYQQATLHFLKTVYLHVGAGIPQSLQGLATIWKFLGSNPGEGEIFSTRPDRPWGPPSLLYNGYRVFPGGKAAGAWRWPPTPSGAEVKERVELYICSPSGPSWPVLGWPLPLHLYLHVSYNSQSEQN